jgi:hypothetical protein
MQFEDFDKRIRDAADNHHPAYEEKAWTKMEKLLNKHMPEEKDDRRRIIFFLLLFLLLAGGTWLFISKPWQQSPSPLSVTSKEAPENSAAGNNNSIDSRSIPATSGNAGTASPASNQSVTPQIATTGEVDGVNSMVRLKEAPPATIPKQRQSKGSKEPTRTTMKGDDISIVVNPGQKARKTNGGNTKTTDDKDLPAAITTIKTGNPDDVVAKPIDNNQVIPQKDNPVDPKVAATSAQPPISPVGPVITKDPGQATSVEKKDDKTVTNTTTAPETPAKKKAGKKQNENGLFFTASAGPDISAVGSKMGKVRPVYGLGLSYTLNRFTIRSGFYATRKIYTADPKDYKPTIPPASANLYQIDANCKIYEIPVSVAWNFAKKKNHSWFGAAGLSSYLMKQEDYDYIYKYPGGPPVSYRWSVTNENKHIFSVLSLSAGYTRKLGKTFSFSAEPYVKVPLTGVGLGNVKLNSGGVLFTINARLTGKDK